MSGEPTRASAESRDVRHHAARRVAARGDLADGRGQASDRGTARLAGRSLHRSRLSGREPEGRRVLPARAAGSAVDDVDVGRVRIDPPRQGKGRQRPEPALSRRRQRRHRVHRREIVGLPRRRGTRYDARRGRRDGGGLGGVPAGRRTRRDVRRGALLRRLQAQPRVHAAGARGGGDEGRVAARAVRHERRFPAARGRAHRARGRDATSAATSASRCTYTTTPAPASRTRSPVCAAVRCRCRERSTATASAPATATSRRSSRTCR